jgi:Fe-S oxidoreductase
VLGYASVFEAADAVPQLLRALPPADESCEGLLGLEGFDVTLVRQMRERDLNTAHLPLLPGLDDALDRHSGSWLLAEIGADTPAAADALTQRFLAALPPAAAYHRLDSPARQRDAWSIRESGLGATALRSDGRHNSEGWEDAAVAPEKLGTYLRELTKLWAEFGYDGAWYGHFGQGCVHTRNNFDLHTPDGLRAYRAYVERAADLVVSLGGSLSGEHGDGQARGELLERMYGPALVDAFRQVKAVFDPRGRMNPGKVVDPYPLDAHLRYGPAYRTHPATPLIPAFLPFDDDAGSLQRAAERCVGVGRCRRDDTGVMCPSYRATRDERHSTRGRAKLLVELFQGEVTPATWRNEDVRDALDLCLACKGCAVDCPTHVDMAAYKAEFLAHHYRRRLRPREMYALGMIPWLARFATRTPRLANAALTAPGISPLLKRLAGVTMNRPAPRFAHTPLRRSPRAATDPPTSVPAKPSAQTVVLWPDTFTDAYRPELGLAWKSILESAGQNVIVPDSWACCARPLYDAGMLRLARRTLRHLLDILDPYITADIPIVVPEPSCLAAFRDESPKLLHDDPRAARLAGLARSPAEHLLTSGAVQRLPRPDKPADVLIHPHCHARAVHADEADRKLLELLGHRVTVADAGCCGLAGSFGFSAAHEQVSRTIGEKHWLPGLRAAASSSPNAALVIDGFSCATQYTHLALDGEPRATTLAQLLSAPPPE